MLLQLREDSVGGVEAIDEFEADESDGGVFDVGNGSAEGVGEESEEEELV